MVQKVLRQRSAHIRFEMYGVADHWSGARFQRNYFHGALVRSEPQSQSVSRV
jgi:hypothetical protein